MATLCKTLPSVESALHAAAALTTAGVPDRDFGVLIGSRYHDVRAERAGGFAGPVDPDAPFGKYAGPPRARWQAAGGFVADPDDQRQGSFADTDGILTVTPTADDRRITVADDDEARRLLTRAHVPDDIAQRMVGHLHEGHAVLFVDLGQVDLATAEALIAEASVPA
jgi:hypothetical protein